MTRVKLPARDFQALRNAIKAPPSRYQTSLTRTRMLVKRVKLLRSHGEMMKILRYIDLD